MSFVVWIPLEGDDEEVRLLRHALDLLIARAAQIVEPPESLELYASLVANVAAGSLDPFGWIPPSITLAAPKTIRALRETFVLPIDLPEGRRGLRVSTRGALLQAGQLSTLEEVAERHRRLFANAPADGWGDWACGICPRTWPDGSEPDTCPDCGTLLVRVRTPREGGPPCHE